METALVKKLLIKPAQTVLLVNPPENYAAQLDPLPQDVQLHFAAKGIYDGVQLFVQNSAELKRDLNWLIVHLRPDTVLWIMYPKKSSGIATDLAMMMDWEETTAHGLRPVASAAVNATWTALRFKPADMVKLSEVRNSEIEKNDLGQYIDIKNKTVMLPADLKSVMEEQAASVAFFESLSYTNKKEYLTWVLTARQQKTRHERMMKMVEKLLAGKKNPSEK